MKYPPNTTSKPLSVEESRRVLLAIKNDVPIGNEQTESMRDLVRREREKIRSKKP